MDTTTAYRLDHPRSRGVYGGSPGEQPPAPRIIPARAGFTRGVASRMRSIWDHPRSRGVYAGRRLSQSMYSGSSPLARGLPPEYGAGNSDSRIIPARAGFTRAELDPGGHPGDHPRSRGVYRAEVARVATYGGSSPLARGLPAGSPVPQPRPGIIPARAGFTHLAPPHHPPPRDHPRSRGVYWFSPWPPPSSAGSSPLARGLHGADDVILIPPGIIPARAGFTGSRGR